MQRVAPPRERLTLASRGDQFSPLCLTQHIPDLCWHCDPDDASFDNEWNGNLPFDQVSFLRFVRVSHVASESQRAERGAVIRLGHTRKERRGDSAVRRALPERDPEPQRDNIPRGSHFLIRCQAGLKATVPTTTLIAAASCVILKTTGDGESHGRGS